MLLTGSTTVVIAVLIFVNLIIELALSHVVNNEVGSAKLATSKNQKIKVELLENE